MRLSLSRYAFLVCLVVGLLAVQGCQSKRFDWMRDLGRAIDPVAKGVEEYGTISMSSPLLIRPNEKFAFDAGVTPAQFYADARKDVAGAAALSIQRSLDAQLGVKFQGDINALLQNIAGLQGYSDDLSLFRRAQAMRELQASTAGLRALAGVDKGGLESTLTELKGSLEALRQQQVSGETVPEPTQQEQDLLAQIAEVEAQLSRSNRLEGQLDVLGNFVDAYLTTTGAPTSRPAFPTLAAGTPPPIDADLLPTSRPAQMVLANEKFTGFGGLIADKEPTLPNRSALLIAAGDTVTHALLQFLSNPSEAEKFKDKVVLLGVSMVSVAPGNRTYRGYAAEVSLSVSYDYQPVRAFLLERLGESAGRAEDVSEIVARGLRPGQKWDEKRLGLALQSAEIWRAFERREDFDRTQFPHDKLAAIHRRVVDVGSLPDIPIVLSYARAVGLDRPRQQDTLEDAFSLYAWTNEQLSDLGATLLIKQRRALGSSVDHTVESTEDDKRKKEALSQTSPSDDEDAIGEELRKRLGKAFKQNPGANLRQAGEIALQPLRKQNPTNEPGRTDDPNTNTLVNAKNALGEWGILPELRASLLGDPNGQFIPLAVPDVALNYDAAPLVAAVSPFTDSQTLDLQSSIREQQARALQIAASLSGLGATGQAKYFRDYVKRLEQDVATRGAENFVSAFSTSGGVFGYQIGPRLRAIDRVGSKDGKPDHTLERMSFPVLIIIGIDRDDLNLRIRPKMKTDFTTGEPLYPDKVVEIVEPALKFRQTTRWIPLGVRGWDWIPIVGHSLGQTLFRRRLSEVERMDWAARLYEANAQLDDLERRVRKDLQVEPQWPPSDLAWKAMHDTELPTCRDPLTYQDLLDSRARQMAAIEFARNRVKMLDYAALDSTNYQAIPEDLFFRPADPPQLDGVVPTSVSFTSDQLKAKPEVKLVLAGKNLRLSNTAISVYSGKASTPVSDRQLKVLAGGGGIEVTFTPDEFGVYFFMVKLADAATLISPPFKVLKTAQETQPKTPLLTIRRSGTQGSVPFEDKLEISPNGTLAPPRGETLWDLIGRLLGALTCPQSTRDDAEQKPTPAPEQKAGQTKDPATSQPASAEKGGAGTTAPKQAALAFDFEQVSRIVRYMFSAPRNATTTTSGTPKQKVDIDFELELKAERCGQPAQSSTP